MGLIARGKTGIWNIQSYHEAAVFFFPVKPILQTSPFKTGLAYLLRPPSVQFCCCCRIPVVSARKVLHEQQNEWDLKSWCPRVSAWEASLVPAGGWALTSQGPSLSSKKTFGKLTGTLGVIHLWTELIKEKHMSVELVSTTFFTGGRWVPSGWNSSDSVQHLYKTCPILPVYVNWLKTVEEKTSCLSWWTFMVFFHG